jgi:hypothetical protein
MRQLLAPPSHADHPGQSKTGSRKGETSMPEPFSPCHKEATPGSMTGPNHQASKTSLGKKPYKAFESTGKPSPSTEFRCVLQPSQAPQSRFFMAVVFSSDGNDAFTLLYSYMAVEVKGRNLRAVRRALQLGCCEFVQQYHESAFTKPGKGDPVIESIHFHMGEKLDELVSVYREGK